MRKQKPKPKPNKNYSNATGAIPFKKKSPPKPPSELPTINPTNPPTDQQIHWFKPTDQPIQTHHQPIPAHRSNLQNPKPNTDVSSERERRERGSEEWGVVTRERQRDKVRVRMREDSWENKILFLVLQLCYSAILKVKLHCSSIVIKFSILAFYKSECGSFLGLYVKFCLHMAYGIPNVNALSMC